MEMGVLLSEPPPPLLGVLLAVQQQQYVQYVQVQAQEQERECRSNHYCNCNYNRNCIDRNLRGVTSLSCRRRWTTRLSLSRKIHHIYCLLVARPCLTMRRRTCSFQVVLVRVRMVTGRMALLMGRITSRLSMRLPRVAEIVFW